MDAKKRRSVPKDWKQGLAEIKEKLEESAKLRRGIERQHDLRRRQENDIYR